MSAEKPASEIEIVIKHKGILKEYIKKLENTLKQIPEKDFGSIARETIHYSIKTVDETGAEAEWYAAEGPVYSREGILLESKDYKEKGIDHIIVKQAINTYRIAVPLMNTHRNWVETEDEDAA